MQFEYEVERLIEEVEKRPGIWKFSDANKTSTAMRMQLWHEVAISLLDPDVSLDSRDIYDIVTLLQKRWRTIRDSYVKQLGHRGSTSRPYIYSKLLTFLDCNYLSKSDDKNDKPKIRVSKREIIQLKKEIESEEEAENEDNNEHFQEPLDDDDMPLKRPRLSPPQDFTLATTSAASANCNPEQEDCDKMFLLSMLTHLKNIPEAKRIRVKVKLLEVIENALNESETIIF